MTNLQLQYGEFTAYYQTRSHVNFTIVTFLRFFLSVLMLSMCAARSRVIDMCYKFSCCRCVLPVPMLSFVVLCVLPVPMLSCAMLCVLPVIILSMCAIRSHVIDMCYPFSCHRYMLPIIMLSICATRSHVNDVCYPFSCY